MFFHQTFKIHQNPSKLLRKPPKLIKTRFPPKSIPNREPHVMALPPRFAKDPLFCTACYADRECVDQRRQLPILTMPRRNTLLVLFPRHQLVGMARRITCTACCKERECFEQRRQLPILTTARHGDKDHLHSMLCRTRSAQHANCSAWRERSPAQHVVQNPFRTACCKERERFEQRRQLPIPTMPTHSTLALLFPRHQLLAR